MKSQFSILFSLMLVIAFIASCDDDKPEDPEIPNEEELITTLNYRLTPIGGGAEVLLSFKDLDGEGGDSATVINGVLDTNTTYLGALELLNELEVPAESITDEVADEAEEHQFFFNTTLTGITLTYEDMDQDGRPIGLATKLQTSGAESGSLTIILRHEPNKSGAGVANGDITNAGGETDIEVTFTLDVQ